MNFLFIYGCRPSTGVKANTTMVYDIMTALVDNKDRINAMALIPESLDDLKGNDATFETVSSSRL